MHNVHDLLTRWPALDVAAKRDRLLETLRLFPGQAGAFTDALAQDADAAARALAGLWNREPAVWSADPRVQQKIADRLGWLTSPAQMAEAIPRLESFAASIAAARFTDVVLLGMGGSSLAPEVLRAVLGTAPDRPRFHMLDSTDPAAVRAVATEPARTLYILASKSGTTIEPNSLAAHFQQVLERRVQRWSDHFVAITDEGTELARRARQHGFREVFINPSDIGGRYSALSFFGLVPAALMGHDVQALVGWGLALLSACEPGSRDIRSNPAAALGLAMGAAARMGRDKLTLLAPKALEPFGLWVEQLVAESTGKAGKGVIPIAGEPLAPAGAYGADRFFVRLRLHGALEPEVPGNGVDDLKGIAPLAEIELGEPSALGAEFIRWEIATAIAGALLGVNPFDEPNVQQAKDATAALLESYVSTRTLPVAPPHKTTSDGVQLSLTSAALKKLGARRPEEFLTLLAEGDYFGVLAFLGPDPELDAACRALRLKVRERTRAATMFGYGPRYLHSTGQLHKGGPNTGVFLLISSAPRADLEIPGKPFSFGTLELAQALGDFASLDATGRRALHVHLPAPDAGLLGGVGEMLLDGLRTPRSG